MDRHRQFIDAIDMRRTGPFSDWNAIRAMCLILLLCTSTATWLSAQQSDTAASGVIRALEREWVEAQSHNDNRALSLILDGEVVEVVYVEYGRLVTKADYLLRIKHQDASTDEIVMEPIIVCVFGKTAIVTGSYRETQRLRRYAQIHALALHRYLGLQRTWLVPIAAGSTPTRDSLHSSFPDNCLVVRMTLTGPSNPDATNVESAL